MKNLFFYFVLVSLSLAILPSCEKENVEENNNSDKDTRTTDNYVAAASYGDLISFSINKEDNTYSFENETTNQTGTGNFSESTNPKLDGVYEVSQSGKTQYIVEIPGVISITSLQLGNTLNKMAIGLSSDVHDENTYNVADFAGKWIYMNFDDEEQNPGDFWGGTQLNSDGLYTSGSGNDSITEISFIGNGNGTISIDENDNSRILAYEDGIAEPLVGSLFPGKALLIDNGEGNGFSLAVSYPETPVNQSELAGSYKGVLLTTGSGQGAMNFEIPESGKDISYYITFNSGEEYEVTNGASNTHVINSFERVPTLNNVFKMVQTITFPGELPYESIGYMVLLPGDILMYFGVEEDEQGEEYVAAYGVSAKID
jgi:hypothetical protein